MRKISSILFVLLLGWSLIGFAAEELKIISATPQGDLNTIDDAQTGTEDDVRAAVLFSLSSAERRDRA